jgi:hypothetical protein
MIDDHDELVLASAEPDAAFLDLTDQVTERLQAGEPVDAADLVDRYPQWAGAIRELLPTINDLVNYGRAVDRDRWRRRHRVNANDAIDHKP